VRSFTLDSYKKFVGIITNNYKSILRFDNYFLSDIPPESFVIFRHDIDRRPYRALVMAEIENSLGVCSTYYFRIKKHTFNPTIISKISQLGHEIGYHYESLSDTDGNMDKALIDFEYNLDRMRQIVPVKTISMHGRPFKKYDNRDIWKNLENAQYLKDKLNILGEVYLDIDYSDIAYINDTGRNWISNKSNIRDKIISDINSDFNNETELREALINKKFNKIIFQIHPERWNDGLISWLTQYSFDLAANTLKALIR